MVLLQMELFLVLLVPHLVPIVSGHQFIAQPAKLDLVSIIQLIFVPNVSLIKPRLEIYLNVSIAILNA